MRPWRLRPHRRFRRSRRHPAAAEGTPQGPTSLTSFESGENHLQQQVFPNFGNRLSPLGGRPQSKGKAGDDYIDGAIEVVGEITLPENQGPSRPPLSNIFPMLDNSPQVTPLRASSVVRPTDHRRHSTPIIIPPSLPKIGGERRESASSDTSVDKLRQGRRERRASVTRELPLLPKRGDDPFQTTPPITPAPQISPYSEYNEPAAPALNCSGVDYSRPDQITLNFGPTSRPPVGPGGALTYPPTWLQPRQQLQELEEELEEDGEGDGEEEGVTRLDEVEDFKPGAPNLEPSFTTPAPDPTSPRETTPSNKGALGKILRVMSSSKHKKEGTKPVQKLPSGAALEKDAEGDVKGFDDFFLY